jgi:hypothetical protein
MKISGVTSCWPWMALGFCVLVHGAPARATVVHETTSRSSTFATATSVPTTSIPTTPAPTAVASSKAAPTKRTPPSATAGAGASAPQTQGPASADGTLVSASLADGTKSPGPSSMVTPSAIEDVRKACVESARWRSLGREKVRALCQCLVTNHSAEAQRSTDSAAEDFKALAVHYGSRPGSPSAPERDLKNANLFEFERHLQERCRRDPLFVNPPPIEDSGD